MDFIKDTLPLLRTAIKDSRYIYSSRNKDNIMSDILIKVRKMSYALTFIASLIKDNTVLSGAISGLAIDLNMSLIDLDDVDDSILLKKIRRGLSSSMELLSHAVVYGALSADNFSIIIAEVHNLSSKIKGLRSSGLSSVLKSVPYQSSDLGEVEVKVANGGDIKEEKSAEDSPLPKSVPEIMDRTERRLKIIEFLRAGRIASIRDILVYFDGLFSEKTVQREISSLLSQGIIKRYGARRWSKYALS